MDKWRSQLRYDPIPLLGSASDEAIKYQVSRDLFEEDQDSVELLWETKQAKRFLRKQQEDGSWRYPNPNKDHPAMVKAAEFLFSCQTDEGDFRGVYWNQYTPTYSAAFMELLIKAGYGDDSRIALGFEWLLSIRQDDGGWVIPFRTANLRIKETMARKEPVEHNRARRFSHMATGMVLRAFA
ncbi:MAG: prenyltransferase/squalene oxidase repeat-containing protein, partial [Candidatus Thorarchaeota archaeon]